MVEFTLYNIKKDGLTARVIADQGGEVYCILPLSRPFNQQGKPIYSKISPSGETVWLKLESANEEHLATTAELLGTKPLSPDISQKISGYYQDAVKQIRTEYEKRNNTARVTEEYYDSRIRLLKKEKEIKIKELSVDSEQRIQNLEPVCRLEELVDAVS